MVIKYYGAFGSGRYMHTSDRERENDADGAVEDEGGGRIVFSVIHLFQIKFKFKAINLQINKMSTSASFYFYHLAQNADLQ